MGEVVANAGEAVAGVGKAVAGVGEEATGVHMGEVAVGVRRRWLLVWKR